LRPLLAAALTPLPAAACCVGLAALLWSGHIDLAMAFPANDASNPSFMPTSRIKWA